MNLEKFKSTLIIGICSMVISIILSSVTMFAVNFSIIHQLLGYDTLNSAKISIQLKDEIDMTQFYSKYFMEQLGFSTTLVDDFYSNPDVQKNIQTYRQISTVLDFFE